MSDNAIITELLSMYRGLPCLWDVTDENYRNREVRYEALSTLLEIWKAIDPDANIDTIKKKIDHMRTAFLREWKKVQESKCSPDGKIHKPLLWYYDQLQFIRPQSPKRSESDPLSDYEYNEDFQTRVSVPEIEVEIKPRPAKRNHIEVQGSNSDRAETMTSRDHTLTELLGQSYSLQLKEMTKIQRCIAEKMIAEVLFYGKLDLLSLNTTISLNNHNKLERENPDDVM